LFFETGTVYLKFRLKPPTVPLGLLAFFFIGPGF